jgi:BirA family biotin operon repressor/biotin-[acetyl-CoA-carboxylase] ligase
VNSSSITRLHIGLNHIHLPETDSTNNRAAEFAREPSTGGTVITAGVQTRGRGQYGRVWSSEPDSNVLMSVLLFPPPTLRHPAILTAFAAVTVSETVALLTGERAEIKWPNDVLFQGSKICGILIESGIHRHGGDSPQHFIVGIGLNVNQSAADFAARELTAAASLAMITGRRHDVSHVTDTLIDRLDIEYDRLMQGEIAHLESRWKQGIGLVGQQVTVERMDGETHEGHLKDLGFESVDLDVRSFKSAEVRHVRGRNL